MLIIFLDGRVKPGGGRHGKTRPSLSAGGGGADGKRPTGGAELHDFPGWGSHYTVSVDNQAFLHARFFQGEVALELYRAMINRCVCHDFSRNQEISVARATKAVADYRQAAGHPEGLAELAVFYCESCKSHLSCCGMNDADYFNALADMFEQALQAIVTLDPAQQDVLVERLERVRHEGRNWGWGVGDEMNDLMAKYGLAGK